MLVEKHRRPNGLSLIELLVVVLIVSVIIGTATLGLGRREAEQVRAEADRLAAVLRATHEEAIVRGRILAVHLQEGGYQLYQLDERQRFVPVALEEIAFARHRLPPGVRVQHYQVEGARHEEGDAEVGLVFDPSGAIPAFTIVLAAGETRYRVWRTEYGKIRAADDREPPS